MHRVLKLTFVTKMPGIHTSGLFRRDAVSEKPFKYSVLSRVTDIIVNTGEAVEVAFSQSSLFLP